MRNNFNIIINFGAQKSGLKPEFQTALENIMILFNCSLPHGNHNFWNRRYRIVHLLRDQDKFP